MARDQGYVVRYFQEHQKVLLILRTACVVLVRLTVYHSRNTRMNFTCRRELKKKERPWNLNQ